jgi:hypothetical protein
VATIQKANRAAENLAKSTGDAYKAIIDHNVAVGERNVRFTQGIVDAWTREIRSQAESNRAVTQELVERAEQQRDALQTVVEESVNTYMDFLYAPFSYYKQGLSLVEDNVKQVTEITRDVTRKATREATSTATVAAREATGGFPIPNYDTLTVEEVSKKLDKLSAAQLREVRDYEKKNKNRETLIEQFDRKLKAAS